MRKPLPLDSIDVADLSQWVDSRDYCAAYFDPATGETYPAFEGEVLGPDGEPVDLDEVDWIPIGGASSHAAYQDMETFADAVGDPDLARRLVTALNGKGAFRRFRDEIYHQSEEIGRAWNSFRDAGAMLRALEWLQDEELVTDAEADERAALLRQEAQQALDVVRPAPRGSDAEAGTDDPVQILRDLPAEHQAQFRAEYVEAIEKARQPEEYAALVALVRLWRLRAAAYSDPGLADRLAAVRTGDTSDSVSAETLFARRRSASPLNLRD